MDSSFEGFLLDRSKCSKLSIEQKRELVHGIAHSDAAPLLQSWSRKELLEILCAEMGKERKYTGMTKPKMIEHLMKVVSEKKSVKRRDGVDLESPSHTQDTCKRQRKSDNPTRWPIASNSSFIDNNGDLVKGCQNSACRAILHPEDAFCKRCTCCICYQYDDNKDPSLWLFCSSEPPYEGDSCGRSCHLECAIKHEIVGISEDEQNRRFDGIFYCIYCKKVNDLLGCWRKQLTIAMDTRRVDVLCYRVSLSQMLLHGTEKYVKQNKIVQQAAKMLEGDVGPLAASSMKMGRGIVNRLSSGPEVQKLCASAVESLGSMLAFNVHEHLYVPTSQEDVPKSLVAERDPTPTTNSSSLSNPPSSEGDESNNITTYCVRDDNIPEKELEEKPGDSISALEDERANGEVGSVHNSIIQTEIPRNFTDAITVKPIPDIPTPENILPNDQSIIELETENESNSSGREETVIVPFEPGCNTSPPVTPFEPKSVEDGGRNKKPEPSGVKVHHEPDMPEKETQAGSSSKKTNGARWKECIRDGSMEGFEYCVKTIRQLECEGYIEKNFRVKFLTWYSLQASPQEKRTVKVYVDTFIDEPVGLAGQLVDTFSDVIFNKKPPGIPPYGFCTRLFHRS